MTSEELSEILKLQNLRKIARALRSQGFINCKTHAKLKKASFYDIVTAPYEEADPSKDAALMTEYCGNICHDVKGLENYQFVIVEMLAPVKPDSDIISTQKILIYAKEILL